MDWKNIIKVDFSGNAGARTSPDKKTGKGRFNPFDPKRKKTGGTERVDHSAPEGGIPENKCDGWPDCSQDAVKYCTTCCFKACEQCYPLFAKAKGGFHPSAPLDHKSRPYKNHCKDVISSASGKTERKVVHDDSGYSSLKDW